MTDFKINKGYDIPISGDAKQELLDLPHPKFVGVAPPQFPGIKPKLFVNVDDQVKVGTPLFFDKKSPDVHFVAPASGRVTAINYGPRRVIESIIIDTAESYEYEEHAKYTQDQIGSINREELVAHLLKAGAWPLLRQRPYSKIADPAAQPKGIFINAMATAPLAADPNFSINGKENAFKAGVAALKVLCDQVHISTGKDTNPVFKDAGANHHTFTGKHPAGLTGTHIAKIDPINKGETVWYLSTNDTVAIGELMLTGRYSVVRIVALAGAGVSNPSYYKTQLGVQISEFTKDKVEAGEMRFISGNVLNGLQIPADGFFGFYDDLLTVLPEGREQFFLGWMGPGIGKPSYTRVYLSGVLSGKKFGMNTNLNGGKRAIIQSGIWENVVALDVHPEFLVKATMAQDLDAMERLGLLECDPEDFALATYLCPSKTEVSQIIADGLELMEKEG